METHHFILSFFVLLILISIPTMSITQTSACDEGHVVPSIPLITFLERLQETALSSFGEKNFDPKLYVDLPLKTNLSYVQEAFDQLPRSANGTLLAQDLKGFIEKYFEGAGDDMVEHDPTDFVKEPIGFLPKVENPQVRSWALEVHYLWRNLSRKVSGRVRDEPDLHTLLPLPEAVVIPGSRFREVYYWDSYWVIRGLLASKMYDTAKAIVTNLIYLMNTYGHVLNGARVYYTNRSQPPLLSSMVHEIYKKTGDLELARKALPALLKEHQFWNSEIHKVAIHDPQGVTHTLSRYYAMWNKPRPESSTTDKHSASNFSTDFEKQQFYREIASTAESGWDFSTRWMRNPSDFTTLSTTSIVPVDLNVFLLKMELDITFLAEVLGEKDIAKNFLDASQARKRAIEIVFWNAKSGQWLDYWLTNGTNCEETWQEHNQNRNVFASNFLPLWVSLFSSDAKLVENVMRNLQSSGLICPFGIATSLTNSGQQWDYPNGWPPLQHMIVEGLTSSGLREARTLAEELVVRWVRSSYVVFKKTGAMPEKMNVEKCGDFGGGGEYITQTGFGWSNGAVLAFLEEFGWPLDRKIEC